MRRHAFRLGVSTPLSPTFVAVVRNRLRFRGRRTVWTLRTATDLSQCVEPRNGRHQLRVALPPGQRKRSIHSPAVRAWTKQEPIAGCTRKESISPRRHRRTASGRPSLTINAPSSTTSRPGCAPPSKSMHVSRAKRTFLAGSTGLPLLSATILVNRTIAPACYTIPRRNRPIARFELSAAMPRGQAPKRHKIGGRQPPPARLLDDFYAGSPAPAKPSLVGMAFIAGRYGTR